MARTAFLCQRCGYQSVKWLGRCPSCDAWDALVEEPLAGAGPSSARRTAATPIPFPELVASDTDRLRTALGELDRVLGGGLVPGAVVLVGGEPGIGKSTLLLQAASALAESGKPTLYVSGEESTAQLRLRGDRLGVRSPDLHVLAETDVDAVVDLVRRGRYAALVVDSIQAVRCAELQSVPGSVSQVREAASRFVGLAKATGVPVLLVGHVTKDGTLAGPRTLEHVVDAVLQFEGDRHHAYRILRALKNRFGPADEMGVFSMSDAGLEAVPSPSEIFLSERSAGAPGSAVLPALEGTRPILVEIQSLVGEAAQGSPRRTALGIDGGRLALILAVLARQSGLDVSGRDVFVNVAGGIAVDEPAADLAVALATASSVSRRPLPAGQVIMGEVGLTGEIRSVSRLEIRLREAARLGFGSAIVPAAPARAPDGMSLYPVRHLQEALDVLTAFA